MVRQRSRADKFGLSWQIVPPILAELTSGEKETAGRVMQAMLKMKVLNIAELKAAAAKKI